MGQPTNAEVKRAQANRTAPEPVPEREETALDFCCRVEGGARGEPFFSNRQHCAVPVGLFFTPECMHACIHA